MRIRHIIGLGFAVNVVLTGGIVWQVNQRDAAMVAAPVVETAEMKPDSSEEAPPVPVQPGLTNVVVERAFMWSDVESDDYMELIGNLREAGCPEETIRDIVIARAEDDFAEARWGLLKPLQSDFWDRLARGEANFPDEIERRHNELDVKRKIVLARLNGELQLPQKASEAPHERIAKRDWSFLPEPLFAETVAIWKEYYELHYELPDQKEDEELFRLSLEELRRARDEKLRAAVGEEHWNEHQLRRSQSGWLRATPGLKLSEEEMRVLAQQWKTNGFLPDSVGKGEQEAALAAVIGEERAAEFVMRSDPGFEAMRAVAWRHGLSRAVSDRGLEVKAAAELEAARIRATSYPTEEIRARAAAALLQSVNGELAGIYGELAWPTLQKYGMDWADQLFADEDGD